MLRAILRFQLSLAILALSFTSFESICLASEVTEDVDPCAGFIANEDDGYRPREEEIARQDPEALFWLISEASYLNEHYWLKQFGEGADRYVWKHLEHANAKVRANSLFLLRATSMAKEETIIFYEKRLNDPCRRVRAVAAIRLVEEGNLSRKVLDTLVRNVDNEWLDVDDTLRNLRHPSIEPIATFMADSTQPLEMRKKAADAFPYFVDGDDPALEPLYDALNSEDPETRELALTKLERFRAWDEPRVIKTYLRRIESNAPTAGEAVQSLSNTFPRPSGELINSILMKWILSPERTDKEIGRAIQALNLDSDDCQLVSELAKQVISGKHVSAILWSFDGNWERAPAGLNLVEFLVDQIVSNDDAEAALHALNNMGQTGFETLWELAVDPNTPVELRLACIGRLDVSKFGEEVTKRENLDRIVTLLDDQDPSVAQMAAMVITEDRQNSLDVSSLLASAWHPDADPVIRESVRDAIPTDPEHVENLILKLAELYPELILQADRDALVSHLLEIDVPSPIASEAVFRTMMQVVDTEKFKRFSFYFLSEDLIHRLEQELDHRHGLEKQRIIDLLYDYLAEDFQDDVDVNGILTQGAPDGLAETIDWSDKDTPLTTVLLYSLYEPKDPKAVQWLFAYLKSSEEFGSGVSYEDASNAERGLKRVAESLEPFLPQLIEMLDSEENRYRATTLLQAMGPKAKPAVNKLTELLEDEDEYEIICFVLTAIGPDANSAAPAVLKYCQSKHRLPVVADCLKAIEADPAELIPEFDRRLADPFQKHLTLIDLDSIAPSSYVAKQYAWALREGDWEMKNLVLLQLANTDIKHPTEIVPLLIQATTSKGRKQSRNAVLALGRQKGLPEKSIPTLIAILRSSSDLKPAAASALGEWGIESAEAVPDLMQMLNEEDNVSTAMIALGQIGEPAQAAVTKIIEDLKEDRYSESLFFRREEFAMVALGSFGPVAKDALPLLLSKYKESVLWRDKLTIAQSIYQISPGFGAVNGIPQPPEPEPVRMQWSW